MNPSSELSGASVSVSASGTVTITAQAMIPDTLNATLQPGTVAGDAVPLKVYPAVFLVRSIVQSTPYPSATNVLTVSLASTVPLIGSYDEAILLAGLYGSLTPDDTSLAISTASPSLFSPTAVWDSDLGESFGGGAFLGVEIKNTSLVAAGEILTFSFSLLNPSSPQAAQQITVTWTGTPGFMAKTMAVESARILPLPGSVAGDATPLKVDAPAFSLKSIRQTTPFPWAMNDIHVTLACNVVLSGDVQTEVTISGILGSSNGQDALVGVFPHLLPLTYSTGSQSIFGANASWTRETGMLRLRLHAGAMLGAGQVCAFSFQLLNPGIANTESAGIYIISSSSSVLQQIPMTLMDTMALVLLNFTGSVAGDALPLRVQSPAFTLARFQQSTTFPGQPNTIFITLATNVDCQDSVTHSTLLQGNVTTFYITGLIGTSSATTPQLPLGGAGAVIFGSSASWNQQSGTLILKVVPGQMILAGSAIVITLPLVNPIRGQQSPRLFSHISGVCVRGGLLNGSMVLPARFIDVDLTATLQEPGSVAGDCAPLFVRSPSFVVRKISQNNPAAGSVNRITLTLIGTATRCSSHLIHPHTPCPVLPSCYPLLHTCSILYLSS